LALLPTALLPLAEVENDHRMFFPFVGLVLAVTWAGALLLPRPLTREARAAIAAGAACLLLLSAWGTRRRNEVWRTEESLWEDVTFKSPRNGRGLMNYGLTLMGRGQFQDALNLFERARAYTPDYSVLEINMGIACGALGRNDEAGRHFQRARWLAPDSADPYYYCGRWRKQNGQVQSAAEDLKRAIALNPAYMPARILLLDTYAQLRQLPELRALAADTLKIAPEDATARRYLSGPSETPESLLELSLIRYRASDYPGCLDAAERALKMRPAYAEAYNNIASAHAAMGHWDDAIRAARQAIRLRPDFQLAKNNLAWAESEKRKLGRTGSQ
jgi:tetratricopeptide (TPR) repeat protein